MSENDTAKSSGSVGIISSFSVSAHLQVVPPSPVDVDRGPGLSTHLGDDEQPQQTPTSRRDAQSLQGDYASLTGAKLVLFKGMVMKPFTRNE